MSTNRRLKRLGLYGMTQQEAQDELQKRIKKGREREQAKREKMRDKITQPILTKKIQT